MNHYLATLFVAADRPFDLAAVEVNKLIGSGRLSETDRFDEVPGYAAIIDNVEVVMQGIPEDVSDEEIGDEPTYLIEVTFESESHSMIPSWLSDKTISPPLRSNGYFDLSNVLEKRIGECTDLRIVDVR
jgi:hypothetical protein